MVMEEKDIASLLERVYDPEVPVLTIVDLGIVRGITINNDEVEVTITPTYSGCPAMDVIRAQIRMVLLENGISKHKITTVLSPAWTTEWMTEAGKQRLKDYGIAPPNSKQQVCHDSLFSPNDAVQCPQCLSYNTRRVSEFGSTACKALYQCEACKEPFDYFKCH